ncbi:MAG: NrfD/PsrC family molybdoenzyme membrane anchor subunit [Halobacteriota archaeon]
MTISDAEPEDLVKPIRKPSKAYYILGALMAACVGFFAIGWGFQLWYGLEVTGLSDWGSGGGVNWGLYIGSFIWWVGIAHGGILVSAAVRLLKIEKYEPVARIAELTTIAALGMAGLMIVVHLGRPDRVVWSVVLNYIQTVHTSPLAWDMTVITMYFVLTATYLSLTLRRDIVFLRKQDLLPELPGLSQAYSVLTVRYTEDEDPVVDRMVWWLALAIIVLAPLLLHGGVIPWLFALLASQPGWFGGLTGPQFLSAALTSAMGGVVVTAYIFRQVYDWDNVIEEEVIYGLGWWMGVFSLVFIWLQLHRLITGLHSAPLDYGEVVEATLHMPVYYLAMVFLIIPLAYVAFQHFGIIDYSMRGTAVAGVFVILGVLFEKTLFVVEGLMHPATSLYESVPGTYSPSWVEISSLFGTAAMVVLFFMVISKIVPIVELEALEDGPFADEEEVAD